MTIAKTLQSDIFFLSPILSKYRNLYGEELRTDAQKKV
jgi:hypothetical protein